MSAWLQQSPHKTSFLHIASCAPSVWRGAMTARPGSTARTEPGAQDWWGSASGGPPLHVHVNLHTQDIPFRPILPCSSRDVMVWEI
jgi:hypothetical protein